MFGMPQMLILDPGTEFQKHFADQAGARGCIILPIDARSPWQNGRTERAGGEWKKQFKLARNREAPLTEREYEASGLECAAIRNRYQNGAGFTPMQRVFGTSLRLPGSLLSDDPIDPACLHENQVEDFHRAEHGQLPEHGSIGLTQSQT